MIVPAQVKIREDWFYTYACQNCKLNGTETPVLKTDKLPSVIPGSYASPEAIAHIAVQKYVMGSPLYRQEQELNRSGVMLSRQTMSNWLMWASEHWFAPIYEQLHKQLLSRKVLHANNFRITRMRKGTGSIFPIIANRTMQTGSKSFITP